MSSYILFEELTPEERSDLGALINEMYVVLCQQDQLKDKMKDLKTRCKDHLGYDPAKAAKLANIKHDEMKQRKKLEEFEELFEEASILKIVDSE